MRALTATVIGFGLVLSACDAQRPLGPGAPRASLGQGSGPPFTVSISSHRDTMLVGQSTQLTAVLMNPGPDTVFGRSQVEWSSSDTTIVKVTSAGVATAVDTGRATVTARFAKWDRTGTRSVTVLAATLRNAAMLKGMVLGVHVLYDAAEFPGDAAYVSRMNREFNGLVPQAQMMWSVLRYPRPDSWAFQSADRVVQNALAHGQMMRGGPLGWHYANPPWLDTLSAANVGRDSAIHLLTAHIDSVVGRYRGLIREWDVGYQLLQGGGDDGRRPSASESVWERLIGRDWVEILYREAARADPGALLYYTDYAIDFPCPRQDSVYALVAGLRAKGIRVDGVTMHGGLTVGGWMPTQAQLEASIARFGALGLRVDLSIEINLPSPTSPTEAELAQQAAEYRRLVQTCDEAPNCDTVWLWGVDDGHLQGPSTGAALLDANGDKKPAWYAVYNYLAGN